MKDCLIIGPTTAKHYDCIYGMLVDGTMKLGHRGYMEEAVFYFLDELGKTIRYPANIYTTLEVHRGKQFIPTKTYEPDKYPTYDNYPAIECKFKNNLPTDYKGKIGVPTSFFFYYPDLPYEILEHRGDLKINGKAVFERLIIRRKQL